jgi:Spy/CpxP family protein refolding chaperone
MKKFTTLIICLTITFFSSFHMNAQTTVVRFSVTLPGNGISTDSAVYLAGNFNGWNPQDENYRMKRLDARHYQLDVPCFANKNYEYKYTLGGWAVVERATDDAEINNRKVFSSQKAKVNDVVVKWHVPDPKEEKKDALMASLSDEQKAKIAQIKDSLGKSIAELVPRLKELLGKTNENLLSDNPDEGISKNLKGQFGAVLSDLFNNVSSGVKTFFGMLTPEQKKQLREKLKNSDNPGALFDLMTK